MIGGIFTLYRDKRPVLRPFLGLNALHLARGWGDIREPGKRAGVVTLPPSKLKSGISERTPPKGNRLLLKGRRVITVSYEGDNSFVMGYALPVIPMCYVGHNGRL